MNSVSGYGSRRDGGPVGWFTGEIQLDLLAVLLASQWHSYRECKHRLYRIKLKASLRCVFSPNYASYG